MNIQIINPIEYRNWDELLLTNPANSFFQTSAWARVLSESYGYQPVYFTCIENGKLDGLLPVMEVNSVLTGRRGVALPFTDICPLFAPNEMVSQRLLKTLITFGRRANWKKIEIRGGESFLSNKPSTVAHLTHTLDLDPDEDHVKKSFKANFRRNIRRAENEGIQCDSLKTRDATQSFYRLHCITRKHHGLPPQPWSFFENIFRYVISAEKGHVVLAFYRGNPVAGAIFFHQHTEAIYKYGASDSKYRSLRPNNLVMWTAIKWSCRHGFRTLNFGRTELSNEGLLRFKRGWGTRESTRYYYTYDFKRDAFVSQNSKLKTSYPLLKRMPLPILRLGGAILYRHVG